MNSTRIRETFICWMGKLGKWGSLEKNDFYLLNSAMEWYCDGIACCRDIQGKIVGV